MKFRYLATTALRGLKTHKTRSALTILGITIGITAIIMVMAIGEGAQNLILNQIKGLGSKTIAVIPGREPKGPTDAAQIFSDSLKDRDVELLRRRENVPHAKSIMPVVFGGESASYGGETYRLTIFGGTDLVADIFKLNTEYGTFFTESDVRSRSNVTVLGSEVKKQLFGDSIAVGERIRIKGQSFRVIGVLPKTGQVSFFNFDEMAIVPYTSAQHYIFGIRYLHRLIIEVDEDQFLNQTVRDTEITLRDSHDIDEPSKDDFHVHTSESIAQSFSNITDILTLFLASIAAISLVVGGIGIMNIMLVAVTERTREIGLRKAIGATNRDIMTQFLLEAVMLTIIGGAAGVFMGSALSFLTAFILSTFVGLQWVFNFPWSAAGMGILVSASVGLVFGLYPAKQAAKKSPIEALRYE